MGAGRAWEGVLHRARRRASPWGREPLKLGVCLEERQPQQRECHYEPLEAIRSTSSLWQTPILVSDDRGSRVWCLLYA